MNKLILINILAGTLCILLAGCTDPQAQLTEDDVSPIDYNKMTAFNVWLEEQKKLEPSNAFKARPMQMTGKGRVRAIPDIAVITGTITSEADQDDAAIDKTAKIINAVQEAVKTQTVELNFTQIQTSEMRDTDCLARNRKSLNRHYAIINDNKYNANIKRKLEQGVDIKIKPRKPQQRFNSEVCPVTHIEAKLSFTARVKPANEAGNIINAFTTAGVGQVDLFGYDFSDYDAHYKEASAKAVKDAKTKAERIAKIAGTNLTEIVSFRVDQPQRTTRFGPQAMIISNHGNRNVKVGDYGFDDELVTISASSQSQSAPANNALKMSLQAGQRTITVNAYLNYLYETPIDGSVVPVKVN